MRERDFTTCPVAAAIQPLASATTVLRQNVTTKLQFNIDFTALKKTTASIKNKDICTLTEQLLENFAQKVNEFNQHALNPLIDWKILYKQLNELSNLLKHIRTEVTQRNADTASTQSANDILRYLEDQYKEVVSSLTQRLIEIQPSPSQSKNDQPSHLPQHLLSAKKENTNKMLQQPKSWHLPLNNEHYFVGREKELAQLREHFKTIEPSQRTVLTAVSGLDGIGKTSLARYYIHHPEQAYALRLWFQANNATFLLNDYREFAQQFKLIDEKASETDLISAVKDHLQKYPNWLAIYADAGEYKELAKFLPAKGGHLLITTRRQEWHAVAQPIPVNVFTEIEAITYLKKFIHGDERKSTSELEEKALKELAKTLGYLPLALAQASAYIKTQGKRVTDYLTFYREQSLDMLRDKTLPTDPHNQPIATTWGISLKALQEDEQKAGELSLPPVTLYMLSYLHKEAIPRDVIKQWLQVVKLANDNLAAKQLVDQIVGRLQQYSLLEANTEQQTISLHELLQVIIQQHPVAIPVSSKTTQKADAKIAIEKEAGLLTKQHEHLADFLDTVAESLREEFNCEIQVLENEARGNALLPHMQSLVKHYDQLLLAHPSISPARVSLAGLLFNMGNILFKKDACKQAKNYYERALKIQEAHYGSDHWQVASTLANLATTLGELGDVATMQAMLKRALKIKETHYGPDHWQIASTLVNLATAMGTLGETKTKQALLERALKIQEAHYGPNHWHMASTLTSLANVLGELGDVKTKQALLSRALKILEAHYGPDHWQLAMILNNLAAALGELGDIKTMQALLERTLKILEAHYGPDHWQVASILVNLATALGALGDVKTAQTLLERALKIQEAHYGPDHWQVASTLVNLATALGTLGDVKTAQTLLSRVLKIQEEHYGPDHWQVAITLSSLATVLGELGDAKTMQTLLERALKIEEAHYGPDHWQVAMTLNSLATALGELGDTQTMQALLKRALKIQEAYYGADHWQVAITLINLAHALGELGNVKMVQTLLQRALKIQEVHYGLDHWQVAITLINLAITYQAEKNSLQALTLAERAYRIFCSSYNNPNHPNIEKAKALLQELQLEQNVIVVAIKPHTDKYATQLTLAECSSKIERVQQPGNPYGVMLLPMPWLRQLPPAAIAELIKELDMQPAQLQILKLPAIPKEAAGKARQESKPSLASLVAGSSPIFSSAETAATTVDNNNRPAMPRNIS